MDGESSMRRKVIRVFLILLAVGVVAGGSCVGLVVYKDQTWVDSPPYERVATGSASVLVVVYSRSGNTLGAAKEAARYFDADLLEIRAVQYPRSISGQLQASSDADDELQDVDIEHDPVDLGRYRLVILCAPTWWYRPAVPAWAFVTRNDLKGAAVFLLMTGNSRYKPEHVDRFAALVAQRGGRFLGHVFFERGRAYWQLSPAELHAEVRSALAARERLWAEAR